MASGIGPPATAVYGGGLHMYHACLWPAEMLIAAQTLQPSSAPMPRETFAGPVSEST